MAWKKRQSQLKVLAEGLVKAGALQFGTFTLPDGSDSSYYVNLRALPSYPGAFRAVVDSMAELARSKAPKVDALCTVPISGLVISSPVALSLGKPLVYTMASRRGLERKIEGAMKPGWSFLLIDDLTTSGKTLLTAAATIREEGGEVKHAAVLIDRLEGARERLRKEGMALHPVTDILELADTLLSMELIDADNFKRITKTVGGR
jgi:orotate phosphoribosyltransferase